MTIIFLDSMHVLTGQISESHISNGQKIIIIKQIPIPKPIPISNPTPVIVEETQEVSEIASQTQNLASSTASLSADLGGNNP